MAAGNPDPRKTRPPENLTLLERPLTLVKSAFASGSGVAWLMLAAFGFAVMSALIKYAGQTLHVTQILFLRQMGMMVLAAPGIVNNFPGALRTASPMLQVARIVFALIAMLCGFSALIHLPMAEATAIGFAKSFFITIFAVLLLKETVGRARWTAVVIGFVGVLIMLRPGVDGVSIYSLFALVGAASAGVVMVIIRMLSRHDEPRTILAWQVFGVALVTVVPAWYFWQAPSVTEWLILAAIAVVSYYSQKANILAFKHGEASFLASLDYIRLLYVTVLGYVLFGNLPGINTWAGAAIIVVASIYTILREARRRQMLASGPHGRTFTNS